MDKIGIVIPTRGFVFSEVLDKIEEIRINSPNCTFRIFYSWEEKIPDSFNNLTKKALDWGASHIFYIEEDTVPDQKVLDNRDKADIVFMDYGVGGWSCSARDKKTGEILWAGVGCTLIKGGVFDKLEKPWFRTDKTLRLNDWKWLDKPMKYGGHDIWFYTKAREAGYSIAQIRGECEHLGIKTLGRKEVNNGVHEIYLKQPIKNYQIIERGDLHYVNGSK